MITRRKLFVIAGGAAAVAALPTRPAPRRMIAADKVILRIGGVEYRSDGEGGLELANPPPRPDLDKLLCGTVFIRGFVYSEPGEALPGSRRETDAELRARIKADLQRRAETLA